MLQIKKLDANKLKLNQANTRTAKSTSFPADHEIQKYNTHKKLETKTHKKLWNQSDKTGINWKVKTFFNIYKYDAKIIIIKTRVSQTKKKQHFMTFTSHSKTCWQMFC